MDDGSLRKIVIIAVIVIIILIVIFSLTFCLKKSPQIQHHSFKTHASLGDKIPVGHQMDKSCGCTKPCHCEKKKEDKCGFCPQCPTCPSCPDCPPVCPPQCPECPLCPGGMGSNCELNIGCAAGLQCQQGVCVCPKPPAPTNLTAVPVFDQTGPGFKLMINFNPVVGANFYDIYVFGPSPQTYLNYVGTSVTTPILLPGVYNVSVYAGSNSCGSGMDGTFLQEIIIDPIPGGICMITEQCPPNQICIQGTCVFPV